MKFKYLIIIFLFLVHFCFMCGWAGAMEYYWGRHPDHERIVFEFQEKMPDYSALRSARERIDVILPEDIRQCIQIPEAVGFSAADLIREVQIQGHRIHVYTRSTEFGFITFTIPEENKIVLDIFEDRLGAKWESFEEFPELVGKAQDQLEEPEEPPAPEEAVQKEAVEHPGPEPEQGHRLRRRVQRVGPEEMGKALYKPADAGWVDVLEESEEPYDPQNMPERDPSEPEVMRTELEKEAPPAVKDKF